MKHVLLISYSFKKTENIGSVRLRGLAKYLPEFGWTPVILTAKTHEKSNDNYRIEEVQYDSTLVKWKKFLGIPLNKTLKQQYNLPTYKQRNTLVDRLQGTWNEIFLYPDAAMGWVKPGICSSKKLFEQYSIDVIVSSSFPPSAHILASALKKQYNIPWVADFRDLWTQNHYRQFSKIRNYIETRLEIKTISSADVLTTVSEPLSFNLAELHTTKKVYSIPNGYDQDKTNPGIPLTKKFSIAYTGVLYKGRRDPEPLLRALRTLIHEKKIDPAAIEINFFGPDEGWLSNDIKKYQLENIVRIFGQVSREESIQKQRESQILLLLTWDDPHEGGIFPGKIFDYLAARRPILGLGLAGGVAAVLLDKTKAGVQVSSEAEIQEQILKYYREYQEMGSIYYSGNLVEIEKFSHREMARKFAEVLDRINQNTGEKRQ